MSRQLLDTSKTVDLITMLLPIQGRHLLLPNVSVAEIIHVAEPVAPEGAPEWLLGMVTWRGYAIPCISFELCNGTSFVSNGSGDHAAVLNGSVDTATVPFYAIATRSTPRMMRITSGEIVNEDGAAPGPAASMDVSVCGEPATIPDLQYIEGELARLMEKLGCKIGSVG